MRGISVILFVVGLVSSCLPTFASVSLAQGTATPSVAGDVLFTAQGVDAPILASAEVDAIFLAEPSLVLERILIPADSSLPTHTTAAPELLLVEEGEFSIEDAFGFGSTVESGEQLAINVDSEYSLTNNSDDDAFVLRLRLSSGDETETGASPEASPIVDSLDTQVLIEQGVDSLPIGTSTMFISRATFDPGAESGEQGHAGPLGIYVDDGTLSVQSPSGVIGEVDADSGGVLPSDAPFVATNEEDVETVVLLVGVVESGEALLAEVTPEPTATVAPTPTIEPTATVAPTPTTEPTATITPSPTPEPTATTVPTPTLEPTPVPTPTPMPAAGTVLYEADTSGGLEAFDAGAGWNVVNGMLVSDGSSASSVYAPFDPDGLANYAVEAEIQVLPADGDFGFGVSGRATDTGTVSLLTGYDLYDYEGTRIVVSDDVIAEQKYEIDGEWHTYRLEMDGNQIRGLVDGAIVLVTQDNRLLDPGFAGLFVYENTQINVRAFRVIALGDGIAVNTDSSVVTGQAEEPTAGTAGEDTSDDAVVSAEGGGSSLRTGDAAIAGSETAVDLETLLPSAETIPDGLVLLNQRSRSLEELAENYPDPTETVSLFTSLGWSGNVVCSYGPPDGTSVDSNRVNGIYVSIHSFDSPESAKVALDHSLDGQMEGSPLSEVAAPVLGEYSRALYGRYDYGNEITLLVQRGTEFFRLSVSSLDIDPMDQAADIMTSMLDS